MPISIKTYLATLSSLIIVFISSASAWEWPWENTSLYGVWDGKEHSYAIIETPTGAALNVIPRDDDNWICQYATSPKTGEEYQRWIDPKRESVHSFFGNAVVGDKSVMIEYHHAIGYSPDLDNIPLQITSLKTYKISAVLIDSDTLKGSLTYEDNTVGTIVKPDGFTATRRKSMDQKYFRLER